MSSGANQQKGDDSYQTVKKKYDEFIQMIDSYENKQFSAWYAQLVDENGERLINQELSKVLVSRKENILTDLPADIADKIDKALKNEGEMQYDVEVLDIAELADIVITRRAQYDKPQILETNYSESLLNVLNEVKFFKILGRLEQDPNAAADAVSNDKIPSDAAKIYLKADEFREVKNTLDDIVNKYNSIQRDMIFAERPMFYYQLQNIDQRINSIINSATKLTWNHVLNGI